MATPTLKSNAGDQKVCKKKNLSWLFGADRNICPSVSVFVITRLPISDPLRDRKIHPWGSLASLGEASLCQSVTLGQIFQKNPSLGSLFGITRRSLVMPISDTWTDFSIRTSHSWKILIFQILWWICYDRYWSKILCSAIPNPILDLKVKVTDSELLCWSFILKFLVPHYF